jgi:dolichyl-phosphate-mannose--protein O-mannosyl transferase
MVLLSILFLGLAAWNVGIVDAPVNNWQTTGTESFYVDLGENQNVQYAYFWVKSGNATVTIYSGAPENWETVGQFALQDRATDYSTVQAITLGSTSTRYLEINITAMNYDSRPDFYWSVPNPSDREPSPFIEVKEIGLAGLNNQQIQILSLTGENADTSITRLADEQGKLEFPPTYMSSMYFDEVYFARSAENLVNGTVPKERTHPPLGKLIQAAGVEIFGETPFGWRIMGVIFGTLIVPLMFFLGKKLFGTWIGGFSAAFLMTFDFMHFTMARIGTTDTYVVFFSLVSQIFFLVYFMQVDKNGWKNTSVLPLFLAVVFFALGVSTKWFTLWSAAGMVALLVAVRLKDVLRLKGSLGDKYVAFFDHPALLLLGFVGIAVLIYFVTYIPEMLLGDSFPSILNLQLSMLSFHSGSVVDTAAAPWWSWPTMFYPGGSAARWFDITYFQPNNNPISTIYVLGNPAVWWTGFALILVLAYQALHVKEVGLNLWSRIKKSTVHQSIRGNGWDIKGIYIAVVFFFSWLIYIFVGRATYIYHFYLSVPLLILAITYFINRYWQTKYGKIGAVAIFTASVVAFILFHPVISGAPIDPSYIHKYLDWFPSRFYAP